MQMMTSYTYQKYLLDTLSNDIMLLKCKGEVKERRSFAQSVSPGRCSYPPHVCQLIISDNKTLHPSARGNILQQTQT